MIDFLYRLNFQILIFHKIVIHSNYDYNDLIYPPYKHYDTCHFNLQLLQNYGFSMLIL